MIKKKKFLEKSNVAEMTELLHGEELDMEAEFNNMDSENNEKVQRLSLLIKGERFVSRYIVNAIYCIIWKYRDITIIRKYRDIFYV